MSLILFPWFVSSGGSRARRQGLIRIHAFGAKPYKSLAYTRRTLAQMRNKTASMAKGKNRPAKKGSPASLSVAQIPGRRSKPNSAEKKVQMARNLTRKAAPPTKNGSTARVEAAKRRMEQTRRSSTRDTQTVTSSRKKEAESQILKNKTLSENRVRSETASKERTAASRVPGSKRGEFDNNLKYKTLSGARQAAASNSSQSKTTLITSQSKAKEGRNYEAGKNSNEDKGSEDEDDEDDDDEDKNNDDDERSTKQAKSGGSSQAKVKGENGGNDQSSKLVKVSPPQDRKSLMFEAEDKNSKSLPSKTGGSSGKERTDKTPKQKDEVKTTEKNKDKERNNQSSDRTRAGLAEDRPKPSPKKLPSVEVKKKPTDIALEEDRLDPDIPGTSKTGSEKARTPTGMDSIALSGSDKKRNGTKAVNASSVVPKKTADKVDRSNTQADIVDKSNTQADKAVRPTIEGNVTAVENVTANGLSEIGLSAVDLNTASHDKNSHSSSSLTSNPKNDTSSHKTTARDRQDGKNSNERFYIEGQLRFDPGGRSQGVANMRISRGKNGQLEDSSGPAGKKKDDRNLGAAAEEDGNQVKDAASSIWNAIHAVLGSQQRDEENEEVEITQTKTSQPAPSQLSSKERAPFYQYRNDVVDVSTNSEEYDSENGVQGDDYYGNYQPIDDGSNAAEYEEYSDEYVDGNEYAAYTPVNDVDYYQPGYGGDAQADVQFPGRGRFYARLVDATRKPRYYGDRHNINDYDQNQGYRAMLPSLGQRRFGSFTRMRGSPVLSSRQRLENLGGHPADVFQTNQGYYATNKKGLRISQGHSSVEQGSPNHSFPVDVTYSSPSTDQRPAEFPINSGQTEQFQKSEVSVNVTEASPKTEGSASSGPEVKVAETATQTEGSASTGTEVKVTDTATRTEGSASTGPEVKVTDTATRTEGSASTGPEVKVTETATQTEGSVSSGPEVKVTENVSASEGTAPGAQEVKTADTEPKPEEMTARGRLQALSRDKLQRYAALSAKADPGPVEIKPLSRVQRLQKIHTIHQ